MKPFALNYLRERAAFREVLGEQYRYGNANSARLGWKGRASFSVRGPEAGEDWQDVEWEAFRVWFHARYRGPHLAARQAGKRSASPNISADDMWAGWRAQYQWQVAGSPVKHLITGRDCFVAIWIVTIFLAFIFGHW